MNQFTRYTLALLSAAALSTAMFGAPHIARADDDDDDNGSAAGNKLDASLQWSLADTAWNKREYDAAASMMLSFAKANADDNNALEACWRAYSVYRWSRPDETRRKQAVDRLTTLASTWLHKYRESNKERAANALWYLANMQDGEGQRPLALATYSDLAKKFAGTQHEADAYWHIAEWMREAHQNAAAIDNYVAYQKVVGISESWNVAQFRIGFCYEDMKNTAGALAAYTAVLDEPKNNWGWGQVGYGSLDAAHRANALGSPDLMRRFATRIIEKSPKDGGWVDIQKAAMQMLGIAPAKKILVYSQLVNTYKSSAVNLSGDAKIQVTHEPRLLVRESYVTKDDPFVAALTIVPKQDMKTIPDSLKKVDADGKTAYTADIVSPDAKGNILGDTWFNFVTNNETVSVPDDLVLTRKWVKKGSDWGEETVRVQSSARWEVYIYLPNNKTNPNNLSNQPNDVGDGGKTFHWNQGFDLRQGLSITFPIECGENVTTYYPKVHLQHSGGRLPDVNETGKTAKGTLPEFSFTLTSDKEFPYQVTFPVDSYLDLDEISR